MGRCSTGHCLAGGGEKGGFKEAFAAEILSEIDSLVGAPVGGWDFEAIEAAARREALRVAALAVARRLNADHSDHCEAYLRCPRCSGPAVPRYGGRRDKVFTAVLGDMRLTRAYYHCEHCRAGFCPRDEELGIQDGHLSPGVLRMVGIVGARVSFEEGHDLLYKLAGIEVPTKEVEREAETYCPSVTPGSILTESPNEAIDHPARSSYRRRPATVLGKTCNDLADLDGIENDGDPRHPASALGTGHDVQFVHLGKQPCPGFPAGGRADFLILRGIRGRGRLSGLSAIPVHRRASMECGAVRAEKCFSLPLKYPKVQDFRTSN